MTTMKCGNSILSSHWLERDLLAQPVLNRKLTRFNENSSSSWFVWLYQESGEYYVTDMNVKLKAHFHQRLRGRVRSLLQMAANASSSSSSSNSSQNGGKYLVKLALKAYSYSAMVDFKATTKNKQMASYVFMFVDEFDTALVSSSSSSSSSSSKKTTSSNSTNNVGVEFVANFDSSSLKKGQHLSMSASSSSSSSTSASTSRCKSQTTELSGMSNSTSLQDKSIPSGQVMPQQQQLTVLATTTNESSSTKNNAHEHTIEGEQEEEEEEEEEEKTVYVGTREASAKAMSQLVESDKTEAVYDRKKLRLMITTTSEDVASEMQRFLIEKAAQLEENTRTDFQF